MDKGKALEALENSIQKLDLNPKNPNKFPKDYTTPSLRSTWLTLKKQKPPRLLSLCLGIIGKHLEDILDDLGEIVTNFPPDIKMAIAAIARRRKLLCDDVVIQLAETSWEILDLSDSDVSDFGVLKVAEMCNHLRAVDISRCSKITSVGVAELVKHCHSLEILRWGGCPRSEHTARRSLSILKPTLKDVDGDSWEELDTAEIVHGAQSLRWLVWPKIDKDSLESLSTECPRIIVNPKASPFGHKGIEIPREALSNVVLDDFVVEDIDPKTWAVPGSTLRATPSISSPIELPMAERFRLAFAERDARMAPKRAKNARQRQRRAEREWVTTSTSAKSLALAAQMTKNLRNW